MSESKIVLVTGGLGYIGSHICVELLNEGHKVIIIDNLSNSTLDVHDKIMTMTNVDITMCELYVLDLCNKSLLYDIFTKHSFDVIVHCAGLKAVNESIHKPLYYYRNNMIMTMNLLEFVERSHHIKTFIFSSSATVYGNLTGKEPFVETDIIGQNITNPYGQTKYMQEQIIRDLAITQSNTQFVLLRYFNPVGAHSGGMIGENPKDIPNNLMPYVMRVAMNNEGKGFMEDAYNTLTIFGSDYNTSDGTCIRDFIHVVDLAKAHLCAMDMSYSHTNVSVQYNEQICSKEHNKDYNKEHNKDNIKEQNLHTFNIGTGKGTSVKELIDTFQQVNNVKMNIQLGERRDGDIESVVCNVDKANNILQWKAMKTLEDIVRDSWNYILW